MGQKRTGGLDIKYPYIKATVEGCGDQAGPGSGQIGPDEEDE